MRDRPRQVGLLERVHWLKASSAFRDLSAADLAVLAQNAVERLYRRKRPLLLQGEPVGAVHLVVEGRVAVRGEGQGASSVEPGEIVGLLELCAATERGIDALAETETLTLSFGREQLFDLLEDHFSIFQHLLRRVCALRIEQGGDLDEAADPSSVARVSSQRRDRDLDLAERIIFMRRTFPFARGRLSALAELSQHVTEVRYASGARIWEPGEVGDHLLLIVRGNVVCHDPRSPEAVRLGPEATLGILEALGGRERWYSATAGDSPLEGLRLDVEHLLDIFEDNLEMGTEYLGHVARSALTATGRRNSADTYSEGGGTPARSTAAPRPTV